MQQNFGEAARLAFEKRIGFETFATTTMARWHWWTREFDRRYRLPAWFGPEDVTQELLVSAWQAVGRFDPARGKTAARFIEWNAVKKTTKAVHKARGCNQHTRKGPNRAEILECNFESPPDIAHFQTPLVDRERIELFEVAAGLVGDPLLAKAIRAVGNEGSVDLAASALYADLDMRLGARMCSHGDAVRLVHRAVNAVVQRYGQEARS